MLLLIVRVHASHNIIASTHHIRAKIQSIGSGGGEIWVLLTRHVNDTRKPATFIACHVEVEDDEAGCSIVCDKQKLSNKVWLDEEYRV